MTKIEWTDETWNPIAGCSDVSEGCRNCYARRMAGRLEAMGVAKYAGLTVLQGSHRVWTGEISFDENALLAPVEENKPTRYFVNSMSDLFHENVTDEMRDKIFAVMALCPQHTFQVLTKRPERMLAYLSTENPRYTARRVFDAAEKIDPENGYRFDVDIYWPLSNVWMGVSVEDQKAADERIPLLLQTPAEVRFISAEPLLGPITFRWRGWDDHSPNPRRAVQMPDVHRDGKTLAGCVDEYDGLRMLDWVIVGGESGPGARPMHPDWARSLRDQCVAAGVPFFFKQWGEWGAGSVSMSSGERVFREFGNKQQWINKATTWINGGICMDATGFELKRGADFDFCRYPVTVIHRVGKKAAGHLLDGKEWHQFPAVKA